MEGEATAEVTSENINHSLFLPVWIKVRVERVQVEIASGASWHPGADLYSFTKVGASFRYTANWWICGRMSRILFGSYPEIWFIWKRRLAKERLGKWGKLRYNLFNNLALAFFSVYKSNVKVNGKGGSTVVAVKMLKEDHTENELLGLVKEVEIMKVGWDHTLLQIKEKGNFLLVWLLK